MTTKSPTDTAEGIAQELVQAGLVDIKDVAIIATNLHQLVKSPSEGADQSDCGTGSQTKPAIIFALVRTIFFSF